MTLFSFAHTCGTPFYKGEGANKHYCSPPCTFRACSICGQAFASQYPTKQLCGKKCQAQAWHHRTYQPRPLVSIYCRACGKPALRKRGSAYCSTRCERRVQARNRRARKRQGFVEHVYMATLVARDNGICQICFLPVDFSATCPHPMSPSLDHVIPLAKGGVTLLCQLSASPLPMQQLQVSDICGQNLRVSRQAGGERHPCSFYEVISRPIIPCILRR